MSKKLTTQEFISKAKQVHGNKFDYSKVVYINNHTKVIIVCPKHGEFLQQPRAHLDGNDCLFCKNNNVSLRCKKSNKQIISDFLKIHGEKYDYSKVEYVGVFVEVSIICKIHGNFLQIPHNHLKGQGCPVCKSSKGESIIFKYLTSKGISFIPQYKFDDCRSPLYRNIRLPFDFFLPDYNICIEFDGRQHFKVVDFGQSSINQKKIQKQFENTKRNDSIKTQYCIDNNIKLIRIPYWEIKNISVILENNL